MLYPLLAFSLSKYVYDINSLIFVLEIALQNLSMICAWKNIT